MSDSNYCRKYRAEIIKYYSNAIARRIIKENIFSQTYNKTVLSAKQGNDEIAELIKAGKPFMVCRFGGNEIRALADVLYERAGGKLGGLSKRSRFKLVNQAGFFPDERNMYERFADEYLEACKQVDMIGVWNMFLQGEITKRYLTNAKYCELNAVESYYYDNPWSRMLEGKKVLVIHPFANTIKKQYEKRTELFENEMILPEFDLKVVKAVQTIAGTTDERFKDWFEALDYMYEEAMKEDFEIALIGCGAYGFPLAARLKKAGKQVIHIGGALQLYFGIKGSRWDNHDKISKLYNDAWVRPGDEDRVEKSSVVEGSCYW